MPQSQPPSLRKRFQSTPSVGRATTTGMKQQQKMSHFNPRPPWGGRPNTLLITLVTLGFQSTPSVGRATEGCRGSKDQKEISIHALRGEGDVFFPIIVKCFFISIHALRGEGDDRPAISLPLSTRFQSTPSVGRATINMPSFAERLNISIHALRGEGDNN